MITLILGRQGSGKTLLMVKMAYDYYKQGKTIYSNVKLNFPFKQLDYEDIVECKLKNAVILLDEIHQLLPARNSMRKISRLIVDGFLSMVRKSDLIILGTTQLDRKVDIRFREEADFIYECSKYAFLEGYWQSVLHSQGFPKDIPIMITVDVQEMFSEKWINFNFIANSYYHLYDTNEIIKISGLEKYEVKKK